MLTNLNLSIIVSGNLFPPNATVDLFLKETNSYFLVRVLISFGFKIRPPKAGTVVET